MPQTGLLRPTAPYFVEYTRVKRNDAVVIRLSSGGSVEGRAGAPGLLGAVFGTGPKEWSPRCGLKRGAVVLLTAPQGAYVSVTVNGKSVLENSLCIHRADVVLRKDRCAPGGPSPPPASRA